MDKNEILSMEDRVKNVPALQKYRINGNTLSLKELYKLIATQDPDNPEIVFPNNYLPKYQALQGDFNNLWISYTNHTYEPTGNIANRFAIVNMNGIIDDDIAQWNQVPPKGFLVKFSCPSMNMSPDYITLDYFININDIQLNDEIIGISTSKSFINLYLENGSVIVDDKKITIDPRITEFDYRRKEVFTDFFKYDFL